MADVRMTVNLRGFADIQKKLDRLATGLREKATAAAINKVGGKGRVEMSRRIRAEFALKAKDVNPQLRVTKASAKGMRLVVVIEAFPRRRGRRSRNVMMFGARPVKGKTKKRVRVQVAPGVWRMVEVTVGGGVSVQIRRDGGRKLIKGAFIGNQGRTVFQRVGNERMPIKAKETIDVPQMFNTRRINQAVIRHITQELKVEVDRAIKLYLK